MLLGGKFIRHAPFQEFSIKVLDPNYSATKSLAPTFTVKDECYYLVEMNPDIHVLLAADMTTVEDPKKDGYHANIYYNSFPISCRHKFDGGIQRYFLQVIRLRPMRFHFIRTSQGRYKIYSFLRRLKNFLQLRIG